MSEQAFIALTKHDGSQVFVSTIAGRVEVIDPRSTGGCVVGIGSMMIPVREDADTVLEMLTSARNEVVE